MKRFPSEQRGISPPHPQNPASFSNSHLQRQADNGDDNNNNNNKVDVLIAMATGSQ